MTAPLCVHCTSHDRRACEGVRQFATITASCSCGCHFAPQVGGAVVLVSDAADALRRELAALRQTHAGDLARERERVEAAEHTLTVEREAAGALVEVATAARARAEAAERECAGLRADLALAMSTGLAECDRLREVLRWYSNERAELLRSIPRD